MSNWINFSVFEKLNSAETYQHRTRKKVGKFPASRGYRLERKERVEILSPSSHFCLVVRDLC